MVAAAQPIVKRRRTIGASRQPRRSQWILVDPLPSLPNERFLLSEGATATPTRAILTIDRISDRRGRRFRVAPVRNSEFAAI